MKLYSRRVGDDDDEEHELLDGGCVVHVLVDDPHQLCDHSPARPDLKGQPQEIFSGFS